MKIVDIEKKIIETLSGSVSKSDTIYIETDLVRFKSIFKYFKETEIFCNFFFEIFKKLIGKEGNIIFPTFSYSWGDNSKNKIFDVVKTLPQTNLFSEFLLKQNAVRNFDPMFSFGVIGDSNFFFDKKCRSSFGKRSVFEKIIQKKGKLIHLGIEKYDPTIVHYIENFFNDNIKKLHYRYNKKFSGIINQNGIKKKLSYRSFVKKENTNLIFNEENLIKDLMKSNLLFSKIIYNSKIRICNSEDIFKIGIEGLKNNKNYFVMKNEE